MKDISAVIKADERRYDGILKKTAKDICESGVKAVFISGGSCAGKTTTTKKLCRCIEKYGRTCHIVSLDDFYRSYGESVYLPDGTRDVETVNSLRIDLVTYALSAILENRTASIPLFDFKTKERTDSHRAISPREGDITVIEGLHALNPLILSKGFLNAGAYKIYLYTETSPEIDSRFVRRVVRDSIYRATDPETIYSLWENVVKNENESIVPFSDTADIRINTYFSYESGILYPKAVEKLSAVPEESRYYGEAQRLIAALSGTEPIPETLVPKHSLLREFI